MVSSPNYERVKKLIELTIEPLGDSDYQENSRSGEAHGKVDNAHSTSSDFATDQSTGQSQTKEGASGWMTDFVGDANLHMSNIATTKAHHVALRDEMSSLVDSGRSLSPVLVPESLEYLRNSDEKVTIQDPTVAARAGAVEVTGRAYIAALEAQNNEKREAAADGILDKLNARGSDHASGLYTKMDDYTPKAWQPAAVSLGAAVGEAARNLLNRVGRSNGGGGGGGGGAHVNGGGGLSSVTTGASGTSGWVRPTGDQPGSISNPITDPNQLAHIDVTSTPINPRMTPNGPAGGHMPADVLNANDPAWRATPPVGGNVARIAGGTLVAGTTAGVGGLAAARGGGGFSGIGGLATGSSGSALRSVAPAGGVLRPSAMPGGASGVAGRGGVGGAGMRSGMAPVGSSGSGGAGSRGGAGLAGRGGVGAAGRGGVVGTGGQSGARSAGVAGRGGAGVAGRGGAAGRGGVSGALGREAGAGSARGGAGVAGRGGAGVAGRGGAGTAGRGGVSGVAGREAGAGSARGGAGVAGRGGAGAGGRGGAGVAGRGGAGGRGVLGGGSSAGRGEKETQRRNYDVVRIDGIEEQSTGLVGGAAGSADQLKPLSRDSGEDW